MSRFGMVAAGLFLVIATPLTAQDGGNAATQPQDAVANGDRQAAAEPEDVVVTGKIPDADKKVCKTDVVTGSIMPKRICRTKGEWAAIRERGLARLERMKREQEEWRHTNATLENQ
jgi:hypothetical protein